MNKRWRLLPLAILLAVLPACGEGKNANETAVDSVFQESASGTLTMDELLSLYEDGSLAEMAETEGLDRFLQYENVKPIVNRIMLEAESISYSKLLLFKNIVNVLNR